MDREIENILYIDDDPDDLFIFSETLESQFPQYHIIKAETAQKGLDMLSDPDTHPCLIVLDLNMPKMNGIQFLQSLRQNPHWQKVSVVVFSTTISNADAIAVASHGAKIIAKPMNYDKLKETVKTLVEYCRTGTAG